MKIIAEEMRKRKVQESLLFWDLFCVWTMKYLMEKNWWKSSPGSAKTSKTVWSVSVPCHLDCVLEWQQDTDCISWNVLGSSWWIKSLQFWNTDSKTRHSKEMRSNLCRKKTALWRSLGVGCLKLWIEFISAPGFEHTQTVCVCYCTPVKHRFEW